jgi:hypothetical protein
VVCYKNADILEFQPGHHGLYIFYRNGVYSGKGLVEQYEFGVNGQGAGYFRSASFAAAQRVAIVLANMMQPELVEQGLELTTLLGPGEFGHFQHGLNIVLNAQLAKYRGFLRQVANTHAGTPVHGQPCYFLVVKEHPSFLGLYKAHHHIESGGFAGPIGTQQPYNFTLFYIYRHMVYNGTVSVNLYQVLRIDCADQRIYGFRQKYRN